MQGKNRLEKAQSTHTSVVVIKLLEENIEYLNQQLEHIDKLINNHIDQDPTLKQDLKYCKLFLQSVNDQAYYCWGYFIRTSLKKQVKLLHV